MHAPCQLLPSLYACINNVHKHKINSLERTFRGEELMKHDAYSFSLQSRFPPQLITAHVLSKPCCKNILCCENGWLHLEFSILIIFKCMGALCQIWMEWKVGLRAWYHKKRNLRIVFFLPFVFSLDRSLTIIVPGWTTALDGAITAISSSSCSHLQHISWEYLVLACSMSCIKWKSSLGSAWPSRILP